VTGNQLDIEAQIQAGIAEVRAVEVAEHRRISEGFRTVVTIALGRVYNIDPAHGCETSRARCDRRFAYAIPTGCRLYR
jgi:hypothetical protein